MTSILPASEVPPEQLREHLRWLGLPEPVIAWKYFDEAFNRGRERGYAWFHRDRVKGFIGLVPFGIGFPDGRRDMVWTYDWAVQDQHKAPGIGVRLLKRVQQDYPYVGGIGGSEATHAIVPHMSNDVVRDAALVLHLPLRLGFFLEKVETRLRWLPRLSGTPLRRLPWRTRRPGGAGVARIEPGVSPALAAPFGTPPADLCRPCYDFDHLQWIGRAPGVRVFSAAVGGAAAPDAGALLWSRSEDPRYWRAALRNVPDGGDALRALVQALADHVRSVGGWALSVIVSHLDVELRASLKGLGFLQAPNSFPIYLTSKEGAGPRLPDIAGLSYLDTDLAMNF